MYALPDTVSKKKSRRTRTAGHVVRMIKNVMKDRQIIWLESQTERNRLKHQRTGGRIMLKIGLNTQGVEMGSHITCRTGFGG